jgi:TonB family protein
MTRNPLQQSSNSHRFYSTEGADEFVSLEEILAASHSGRPLAGTQFRHFGVLEETHQSPASLAGSATIWIIIALLLILCTPKVQQHVRANLLTSISLDKAPKPKHVGPKIKIQPPAPLPPPPIQVEVPQVKLPDLPKPVKPVEPVPVAKPVPAPPKLVQPPPAPVVVHLGMAQPASVVNNSHQPSAVALGQQNNPVAVSSRQATSAISLGQRGMPGMQSSNTGAGPASTVVRLGSGSATSQNMNGRDNAANAVKGVKLGVADGTGPMNSTGRTTAVVALGQAIPPPMQRPAAVAAATSHLGPKVLFKPRPEFTSEAIKLHIEGTVSVRIKVSSSGEVQILGITSGLGHGLDESAEKAVMATRFEPATDGSGHAVDWMGVVNVAFQLAG